MPSKQSGLELISSALNPDVQAKNSSDFLKEVFANLVTPEFKTFVESQIALQIDVSLDSESHLLNRTKMYIAFIATLQQILLDSSNDITSAHLIQKYRQLVDYFHKVSHSLDDFEDAGEISEEFMKVLIELLESNTQFIAYIFFVLFAVPTKSDYSKLGLPDEWTKQKSNVSWRK